MSTPNIDDGGPAFPFKDEDGTGGFTQHTGMSVRDYFAGEALAGQTANTEGLMAALRLSRTKEGVSPVYMIAESCYDYADAMLAARRAKQ